MRAIARILFGSAAIFLMSGSLALAQEGSTAPPHVAAPAHPTISHDAITRTGHALRKVLKIQEAYKVKADAATTTSERNALVAKMETDEVAAVHGEGLKISTYTEVIETARTDPSVRRELLAAARGEGN